MVVLKSEFKYYKPATLDGACALASKYWGKARMLVGGTDLLVRPKAEQWTPEHVIDLKGIGIDWLKIDKNTAKELAAVGVASNENHNPTEKEIRKGIGGNICRCTGYVKIVKAIQKAAQNMQEGGRK